MERTIVGTFPCGKAVESVVLKNENGIELEALSYGCRIRRLLTKDKNGDFADIVLGFDTFEEYYKTVNFQGAVVGRYANRIAKAEFELDGVKYVLNKNEGENTLHGGPKGFYNLVWDVKEVQDGPEPYVVFSHLSADGEEGYPGNLEVNITYQLTKDDELKIVYEAVCDKKTPFNITNHTYFNLSGDLSSNILDHELVLDAYGYAEGFDDLIPTGKILPVDGTPFDFREGKTIGKDIFADEPTLKACAGYDHTYALNGEGFRKIGALSCERSGRVMEVYTDLPSMQLYTDNGADDTVYKNGVKCCAHQTACLETQMFPDSPHRPEFPSVILEPGKPHKTVTVYKFSVK